MREQWHRPGRIYCTSTELQLVPCRGMLTGEAGHICKGQTEGTVCNAKTLKGLEESLNDF